MRRKRIRGAILAVIIRPDGRNLLTTLDTPLVIDPKSRYWSKIAIFAELGDPRRNITIRFGTVKTRMVWLPDVKLRCLRLRLFVSTLHKRDGQTNETPQDGISRACSLAQFQSHGKINRRECKFQTIAYS